MQIVGLTGGVASGKTTVAELFRQQGVALMDADHVARQLVAPGEPALDEICAVFGDHARTAEGELNRPWLRQRIFSDGNARQRLEAILHPRIRHQMALWSSQQSGPYLIQVIPLLVERGWWREVDRVVVVDCPEAQQRERLMQRDRISPAQADAMLAAQASRAERLARADQIITNATDPAQLPPQVARIHRIYSA